LITWLELPGIDPSLDLVNDLKVDREMGAEVKLDHADP